MMSTAVMSACTGTGNSNASFKMTPLSRRASNPIGAKSVEPQVIPLPIIPAAVAAHKRLDRCHSEPVPADKSPKHVVNSSRYKTELCRPYEESGHCKYGEKCQFAHGINELRSLARHPKYKTELCRTFHTIGFCPYGPRCHFVHNAEEARPKSQVTHPVAQSAPLPPPPPPPPRPRPESLSSTPSPTSSLCESPSSPQASSNFFATPATSMDESHSIQHHHHHHFLPTGLPGFIPSLASSPSPEGSLSSDLESLSLSSGSPGPVDTMSRLPVFSKIVRE